jgi:hypothetical protein
MGDEPSSDKNGRPRIHEILTPDELKGLASDAGMSTDQIAKLLGPLSGLPSGAFQVSIEAGNAIGRSLGFKSSKSAETLLACDYPCAVRALVFALTGQKYALTTAFDTPHGAYFEAQLPNDLFALGGTLQLDLAEAGPGQIRLSGTSEIRGQMFDWGKGKRALADVFAKTQAFAARLGG